ncbi:MAG: hypothetical protein DRO99_02030 [Candidatus Aenigmatarchaeota archaeon]|nr:MAG: hypothetical protein DRO99_02030 [Candidatus Aenigmarchaeota archaeon]
MVTDVYFADTKVRNEYNKLKKKKEFQDLYKFVKRAITDIKKNPECGIAIPKNLIPREYVKKYGINNVYKYDLPNAWRLLYSVSKKGIEIIAIILEWCTHKEYERRFKYRAR